MKTFIGKMKTAKKKKGLLLNLVKFVTTRDTGLNMRNEEEEKIFCE